MKNSILFAIGKQFLCTLTLGVGVVLLSIPSVAEASSASAVAKVVSGFLKATRKVKPSTIKAPIQTAGPVTRSDGTLTRTAVYVTAKALRERRERENRESQNKKRYNW